jgi:hypothetical protein
MCKAAELADRLSVAERRSLELMGAGHMPRRIPGRHMDRLIGLGLAEVIFGGPGLTGGGHRVLGLIATRGASQTWRMSAVAA